MSFTSIILLADIVIFTIYDTYVLVRFGIPANLSITYYAFERRKKRAGLLFPALMLLLCGTALPIWISTTYYASSWGSKFVVFPVTTLICLIAVAASARYKRLPKLIYFHYTCAIIAAACAVAWVILVAYKILFITLGFLSLLVYMGIHTNTLKKCTLFWLENAAFYSILFTLLLIHMIPVRI